MIINACMNAIYNIFELCTRIINIPDMPQEVEQYMADFFGLLEAGAGILANYVPFSYLFTLFAVVVAVDVGVMIYHFIMWLIRKIPFVSVE